MIFGTSTGPPYARSEALTVRLYREEVAPRIDLVLDVSRSMTVTEEKGRAYGELCALLACACASAEADARVVTERPVSRSPSRGRSTSNASSRAKQSSPRWKSRTSPCAAVRCALSSATFCFLTTRTCLSAVSRATARRWH